MPINPAFKRMRVCGVVCVKRGLKKAPIFVGVADLISANLEMITAQLDSLTQRSTGPLNHSGKTKATR